MAWDWQKINVQGDQRTDQALAMFREYYVALGEPERKAFREWVNQIAAPFPDGLEANGELMGKIGCSGDRFVSCNIGVHFMDPSQDAHLEPQVLRQALVAWDRAEGYVHQDQM